MWIGRIVLIAAVTRASGADSGPEETAAAPISGPAPPPPSVLSERPSTTDKSTATNDAHQTPADDSQNSNERETAGGAAASTNNQPDSPPMYLAIGPEVGLPDLRSTVFKYIGKLAQNPTTVYGQVDLRTGEFSSPQGGHGWFLEQGIQNPAAPSTQSSWCLLRRGQAGVAIRYCSVTSAVDGEWITMKLGDPPAPVVRVLTQTEYDTAHQRAHNSWKGRGSITDAQWQAEVEANRERGEGSITNAEAEAERAENTRAGHGAITHAVKSAQIKRNSAAHRGAQSDAQLLAELTRELIRLDVTPVTAQVEILVDANITSLHGLFASAHTDAELTAALGAMPKPYIRALLKERAVYSEVLAVLVKVGIEPAWPFAAKIVKSGLRGARALLSAPPALLKTQCGMSEPFVDALLEECSWAEGWECVEVRAEAIEKHARAERIAWWGGAFAFTLIWGLVVGVFFFCLSS